jgi:cell shape-determining protein MreD
MLSPGLFIGSFILLSLVLSVFQFPEGAPTWFQGWRPQWLLLALILWVHQVPNYRGAMFHLLFVRRAADDGTTTRRILVITWIFGFFVDALFGDPFGLNGCTFALIAYYFMRYRERLQLQTLFQQMIMVFMMVFLAELFRAAVNHWVSDQVWNMQPLTLATSSTIFWPIIVWVASRFIGGLRRT